MTFKFVLAALLALPMFHRDPPGPAKDKQMAAIADAISKEAKTPDEAAFVLTLGWHESAYSLDVHEGRCPKKMCDPDRNGVPRARSSWQLHRNGLDDATWTQMTGVENTPAQVHEAAKRARWALRECRGDVRGAFVILGGRGCSGTIPGIENRVATFQKIRKRM